MKNVDELYISDYKSDYNIDDELNEDKKKKLDYKQFELDDEINKESKLDEKAKQFEIIDNRDQGTKSTKKEKTKTKKPNEIHMSLWFEINRNDFDSLIQDVDNNLNNNEFKTTVDKKDYDLKTRKGFW